MASKTVRNGKIEFLRFAFCIFVLLFHCDLDMFGADLTFSHGFSFFRHGYIGVEFFFLVTGYLMAKSALKKANDTTPLGKSTINFMSNKVLAIFPAHLIAFGLTYVTICIFEKLDFAGAVQRLFDGLPNLFFVSRTGITHRDIIGVEWYISTMMVALLVIYPLCKKYKQTFTRVIAPILALFIVGYLCHKYSNGFSNVKVWDVICTKSQLRAIAEICLGAFTFELSQRISNYNLKKSDKIALTIVEILCYGATFYYIISQIELKYDVYFLFILALGVAISFSGVTLTNSMFNNKLSYFLGKLSLPIYLCQDIFRKVCKIEYISDLRGIYKVIIFVCACVITGVIIYFLSKPLDKAFRNKINAIQPNVD